jgi:hypothetical protein
MMRLQRRRARQAPVVYQIGDNVRIRKEKIKFAKGFEQNYLTKIFKASKLVRTFPQPVYELEDLQGNSTEGQFYIEELIPVIITKNTAYKTDKVPISRIRRDIREYLVPWRGYGSDFDSRIPALSIRVQKLLLQKLYITLSSDSSLDIYPDNTLSAFQVQLPKPIDLGRDNWEVGLCEVS